MSHCTLHQHLCSIRSSIPWGHYSICSVDFPFHRCWGLKNGGDINECLISCFVVSTWEGCCGFTETQKCWFAGILRGISRCTVGRQHIWTLLFNRLTHAQTRPYSNALFRSNFSTRSAKQKQKLHELRWLATIIFHLLTFLFHLNFLNCVFAWTFFVPYYRYYSVNSSSIVQHLSRVEWPAPDPIWCRCVLRNTVWMYCKPIGDTFPV